MLALPDNLGQGHSTTEGYPVFHVSRRMSDAEVSERRLINDRIYYLHVAQFKTREEAEKFVNGRPGHMIRGREKYRKA